MKSAENSTFDICVAGTGPAGLATALAAHHAGLSTAVIGPNAENSKDARSAALFQSSVAFLKALGVWDRLALTATPLEGIRLVDGTQSLFRAPEVLFKASEIGLDAFGYNIANAALTAALETQLKNRVTRIFDVVEAVEIEDSEAVLRTGSGASVRARLIAAADGRNSICRSAAGIDCRTWSYDQTAIVTAFEHSRPHNNISTELHRVAGPLTVVPGPNQTSNLVWVETAAEALRLGELGDDAFANCLDGHLGGLLGTPGKFSPRRMFPLQGQTAQKFAQNRVALVGEAGHVMPPIGAQGLNLSFRDAAELARLVADASRSGGDPGGSKAMQKFDACRRADILSRSWTIDLLNRSLLLSSFVPVHLLRGAGLFAIASIPPLRRILMREGVAPAFSTADFQRSGAVLGDSAHKSA